MLKLVFKYLCSFGVQWWHFKCKLIGTICLLVHLQTMSNNINFCFLAHSFDITHKLELKYHHSFVFILEDFLLPSNALLLY